MFVRAGLRYLAPALVAAHLACGVAAAAEPGEVAQKRSDLEDVTRRIRELRKEIAGTEESRSAAADQLAETERAVSRIQRELRRLAVERADVEQSLAALESERADVEARISARQAELADWLRRHYIGGAASSVAPFLSARDPSALARDAYYLEHLGRARLELINTLRDDLRQKAQLGETIAARRDRIVELAAARGARHAALESMQAKRKQALAVVSEQLRSQRKEEKTLREDQARLGRLVEILAKRAAEREAARLAAAKAAEARAVADAARSARARSGSAASGPSGPRARTDVVGEVRQVAGPTPTGVSFAHLRGKMHFPVRGELVGRFGAQRAEGGTTWRGVFIRAAGGEQVRAVAAGEVVFSDWLRGYGNLIILDHGDDYLSIYGNNDALLRELGDAIVGGDPIASVGASGGAPESGLYFEIRHRGQPLDPLQWVRLN